jgi:hypothetical protein
MDRIGAEARIRQWIRRWWKWAILGYLALAAISTLWVKVFPHIDTPEERAYKACVKDWLDVNKVGVFAVSGSLTDRLIVAHKMCEHVGTRR